MLAGDEQIADPGVVHERSDRDVDSRPIGTERFNPNVEWNLVMCVIGAGVA
jgi:hypothetical protein